MTSATVLSVFQLDDRKAAVRTGQSIQRRARSKMGRSRRQTCSGATSKTAAPDTRVLRFERGMVAAERTCRGYVILHTTTCRSNTPSKNEREQRHADASVAGQIVTSSPGARR